MTVEGSTGRLSGDAMWSGRPRVAERKSEETSAQGLMTCTAGDPGTNTKALSPSQARCSTPCAQAQFACLTAAVGWNAPSPTLSSRFSAVAHRFATLLGTCTHAWPTFHGRLHRALLCGFALRSRGPRPAISPI